VEFSEEGLARFFSLTSPLLNERQQRPVAAAVVEVLGRGGQAWVAEASGMRNTLISGARELTEGAGPSERVRRKGGRAAETSPSQRRARVRRRSGRIVRRCRTSLLNRWVLDNSPAIAAAANSGGAWPRAARTTSSLQLQSP
jgi:hypothetical protein